MEAEGSRLLFAAVAEDWGWMAAAFLIGLVVGWMSYRPKPTRRAARR